MVRRRKEDRDTDSVTSRKKAPKDGNTVILRAGNQRILVREIKPLGPTRYRGVIFGFSPSFAHEYQGMKVGESILFEHDGS
jgi:hypothetical protein